jgi:hypothetical protein
MRVHVGGVWGQLVSSVIWLISATFGTWVNPRASIRATVIWPPSSGHRHRAIVIGGFFIFPLTHLLLRLSPAAEATSGATPTPRIREHGESVHQPGDAGRVCTAAFHAASGARRSLPLELFLPGPHDPRRRTRLAVRHSLRDAQFHVPGGDPDRRGRRDRRLFRRNVQSGLIDRRTGPIRFRLDRALDRDG